MNATFPDLRSAIRSFACGLLAVFSCAALHAWAQQATVTLISPANGTVLTAPASISLLAGATQPTGYTISKVEFFRGGTTLIGTVTTAPYFMTWNNVAQGSYALTAKVTAIKTGSPTLTATSTVVNITVNPPAPTVGLSIPATASGAYPPGGNITLSAVVGAPPSGYTVSKVEFFRDGTLIGTDTTAPYSFIWTNVQQGNYLLSAQATAIKSGSPTLTVISSPQLAKVTIPPTVNLTSPTDGAFFAHPATITLSATASDSDGSIAKVHFIVNGAYGEQSIYTVTQPPYTIVFQAWPMFETFPYFQEIQALAEDNQGAVSYSGVTVYLVESAGPTATLSPTALTLAEASSGTLTATLSAGQASDQQITVTSSNPGIASVPSVVTVPAGQTSTSIAVSA